MIVLRWLTLDRSDDAEGRVTIEALASTAAAQHPAALAEAQQLLDWAWRAFPHGHGPLDDGGEWDHDLQVGVEDGGWHSVALTLSGHAEFGRRFGEAFTDPSD